ncbi:zinc finger protein 558-like [Vanessa tameamea]|uniref:Zinc finger protein 558-like n=1 Tax=Vanessa tameamea TaxID=334116 RepID=A0A8B8IUE6_VANTA
MKSMDFKNICRICLESNKQTFDIYNSYYAKKKVLYCEMLSNCTKLRPLERDGLPRLICKDCSRQLKRTYAFNKQCENSEKTLRSYLKNPLYHTSVNESLIEINIDDIKTENIDVKEENTELTLKHNRATFNLKEEKINDAGDDSGWDADDDNVILGQIKQKKSLTESLEHNDNIIESRKWGIELENRTQEKTNKNVDDILVERKKLCKRKIREKIEPVVHQCDVCGKCLSTKSNLKAHKICHTNLRPFRCDDCPATFRGYSALFQHRKVHSGAQAYHCEYCSKPFRRRTGLINHIRAHTGEKLHSCTICFKNFVQKAQLSTHMKRHKGDKSYLCQECGKGFSVKSDLTVHQRTHNGEKPYACHLCEKTFATSGNLSIHVRIHNKEVKYTCPECQRGFVTYSSYTVHVKRHRGQRDYRCDCGKTFYTSSALKQHRVVHSGLKRYQCKLCERRFAQPSHLTRHFRRDHAPPDAPLPPPHHFRRVLTDADLAPAALRPDPPAP